MSLAPSFEPVLPQTDVPSQTWLAPEAETAETPANPLAGLFRAMRARWGMWLGMSVVLGGALGTVGFLYGTKIYQSEAILRAYPTASGILYDSDDSVLKTFTAFVKAETSAVASHEVMQRATEALRIDFPVLTEDMTSKDLRGSVEIKRSESLIVLKTASKTPAFAAAKLDAISSAYLGLKAERQTERMRSRGAELTRRETELLARLQDIDAAILEAGGEFGVNAISKAHIEKIAQIDALAVRQSEVSRTLEALSASENVASADMNDKDIIRATLLDRGLADLNIELARREAELQVMLLRYTETARPVQDKTKQIEILQEAMQARRQQIQILGQTGALTDQSDGKSEESQDAILALLAKVTEELEIARKAARDLNARRVELDFLAEEREETRDMLDKTRAALDIILVESRDDDAGLIDLMSVPAVPEEPAEDSSKMQAAMGIAGGGGLATMFVLGLGLMSRRLRWSDGLGKAAQDIPVLAVIRSVRRRRPEQRAHDMDRLRSTVLLLPAHGGVEAGTVPRGRCLAVVRAAGGPAPAGHVDAGHSDGGLAADLADSFARTGMKVLRVRANPDAAPDGGAGWRDGLAGADFCPENIGDHWILKVGGAAGQTPADPSLAALRRAVAALTSKFDLVILEAGSMIDNASSELIASVSDVALADVHRGEPVAQVTWALERLGKLPRHAAGLVFSDAHRKDPGLPA